nr:hypothetical protein [uncultured Sphingomonas sp.]
MTEAAGVDYVEVGRRAHELEARHGMDGALRQAQNISEEARVDGDLDDHRFWKAVAAMLTPRGA